MGQRTASEEALTGRGSETEVREHRSQHDSISELPLVTESATVTEVESMDLDRRAEVRSSVRGALKEAGMGHAYERGDGGFSVDEEVLNEEPGLARRVGTLVERAGRPKPMLVKARFRTDDTDGFGFAAGQYAGMRYDGVSRAYSIASSPNEDGIEICVRRVPDGRLSPRICDGMAVGDPVTLRGPYGELVLQDASERDMVFLATGTGVAPFKGMIDYVFEEGLDMYEGTERDVWLFLGAAWRDDLPYHEEFSDLDDEHGNFHYVPTLSREGYLSDWGGETDYVQYTFLKQVDEGAVTAGVGSRVEDWITREPVYDIRERIDPSGIDVYACGINAMVYSLVQAAEGVGVPAERIESEGFG